MSISIERATLVSFFVECILYGLFLSLYAISTVILVRKRRHTKLNKPMLAVSFSMLLLATIHVGTNLERVLINFIDVNRLSTGTYLPNPKDRLYLLKSTAYNAQTVLGDGFLLYRVYLVWDRNLLVVVPLFIAVLASAGVAIGILYTLAAAPSVTGNFAIFTPLIGRWIIAFFVMTLVTNFVCTGLIAGRIFWVDRRSRGRIERPGVTSPMILVIESGFIYTSSILILIILYTSKSFAQYIALDAVVQVIGIVFSLIIVRVGLGLTADARNRNLPQSISFPQSHTQRRQTNVAPPRSGQDPIMPSKGHWFPNILIRKRQSDRLPEHSLRPLEVRVTTVQSRVSMSESLSDVNFGHDSDDYATSDRQTTINNEDVSKDNPK